MGNDDIIQAAIAVSTAVGGAEAAKAAVKTEESGKLKWAFLAFVGLVALLAVAVVLFRTP